MKIILQGNPLSNQHIYQYVCTGKFPRMYMTDKGKKLKENYQWQIKSQWKGKVLKEDIEIKVDLYFKDKRRRDIDNYGKILLDSLEGIIVEDDKQIKKMTITKNIDKENPRIEIEI
jgi:crossover junction endodeoxyribonuclease RusA